jgi:hypothetical protein
MLSPYPQYGLMALGLGVFYAKEFVLTTPFRLLGDSDETWYKQGS